MKKTTVELATSDLATSDLATSDISDIATFFSGPCTFPISPMYFNSVITTFFSDKLGYNDIFFQPQKVFVYYIQLASSDIFTQFQKRLGWVSRSSQLS